MVSVLSGPTRVGRVQLPGLSPPSQALSWCFLWIFGKADYTSSQAGAGQEVLMACMV